MAGVQKLLHQPCTSPAKYTCRCTGILAASLALPAGAVEKILVYSYDLYCLRFAFEDHQKPTGDRQIKEVLETLTGLELRD